MNQNIDLTASKAKSEVKTLKLKTSEIHSETVSELRKLIWP